MPDQRILNHAARIIGDTSSGRRADEVLRNYFQDHRYIRAAEKGAISRAVFGYYRWRGWLDRAAPQRQVEQAAALAERFAADPKSVKTPTLAARAVPEWLAAEMEVPAEFLRQLQREPPLWLRARPGTADALAKALGHCAPSTTAAPSAPTIPDALLFSGRQDLFRTEAFQAGAFEIQDLASQIVGHACAAKPGETWWDACAGEGGKTLHLADLMANKGVVWASDRSRGRLETLKRRAGRAKLFNYRTVPWEGKPPLPTRTRFDGVLVDAPCSGVGTWRRNPQARWTTTPQDVRELATIQAELLNQVATAVKPGGRLVYSVCTLTRAETADVAAAFNAAHPDFEPVPLSVLNTAAAAVLLWPHEINANGMFIAAWRRKPADGAGVAAKP